ncbi:MAG: hypothetical protein C0601_00915 [Candidatus Muiribacterium halophilum]|uniref:SLH domain-containing protein n=1 Tax=Muiribacterium halophilum TaxID=2053465 RepID=A0A2N5ZM50_MUIH1|nr:MAG: hypothetical protein C0601_00915 [Candidatus Muirbacterium halophilum]
MKRFLIPWLLIFIMTISVFAGQSGPIRVQKTSSETGWAEQFIQKAIVEDITPDITPLKFFKGSQALTRGEFAVMISRVLPCDIEGYEEYTEEYNAVKYYKEQAPDSFSDFRYWDSFGYVERITKRGIMNPIKGRFNPSDKITRGEFLKTLLILLQKTDDPFCKIENVADDALKLNTHLTGFLDVSVSPGNYPGWVRMAQEFNILPSREKGDDYLKNSMSLPYKEVFYNYSTRKYEFQPETPISRELAQAIFSNLFVKWDGFSEYIPFDRAIGNTSRDVIYKTINGKTKIDCELVNIDTLNNEIEIKYQERKTEFRNGKIFNTVFVPGQTKYQIAEDAYIWVVLNGKSLKVRGEKPVQKLDTVLKKLRDENIFDVKLNFICVPERYRYNINNKALVKVNDTFEKREVIGYLEVNLIPYEYIGRIIEKTDNSIYMYDEKKGNVELYLSKDIKVVREVQSVDGSTGALTDKIVNISSIENVKVGELVKIKLDRQGKVKNIISRLLRIGVPSNISVEDGYLKTQYLVGKHYRVMPDKWNSQSRMGFITYAYDFDYPGRWRKGGLEVLFENASSLRKVDLYVQPVDVYPVKDNEEAKFENRITFIEAIPKYF